MWKYTQDKDYSLFEEQVGKKEVELHSVFDLKNPGLDFEFKIEATNASGHMINPSEIVKCSSGLFSSRQRFDIAIFLLIAKPLISKSLFR